MYNLALIRTLREEIIEAQKKKIKTPGDLQNIIKSSLVSKNKSILVVIYNNENQISYIGIKLK